MISQSVHLVPRTVPNHGPLDICSFPCSGRMFHTSPRCSSIVCQADSRRNPDFLRQNKQGFSRGRSRQTGDRFVSEGLDESEAMLSSKNGPTLSLSGSPKFQATATPGPREKEIVELFRKVQVRLRERAAAKEEKKTQSSQGKSNETETVDSLLNLLRKHSGNESGGNRNIKNTISGGDFSKLPNGSFHEGKNQGFSSSDSNGVFFEKSQERSTSARPLSKFQRKSPVPKSDSVPSFPNTPNTNTDENRRGVDPVSDLETESDDLEIESDELGIEPESVLEGEPELESGSESESESDELEEKSFSGEVEFEVGGDAQIGKEVPESRDLGAMKVGELRALAKSYGVKGFSKLKKSDLIEALSKTSNSSSE